MLYGSAAVASNNPFAATTTTADSDVLEHLEPTTEFNPFATITDDDQDQNQEEEVFDPFQTIHDDDALNVPFSSEDRDTEDDMAAALSPSRLHSSHK